MTSSQQPVQQPLPLAFINGEALIEQPQDLYIPPDALEVILETFEGPLDLLLYLIRKQKLDIVALPIADITRQYMEYVEVMKTLQLELAGEYLLMAAILAEIKSRLLLPKHEEAVDDEEDPRAELIRRLQEYERVKQAAQSLDERPRLERDLYVAHVAKDTIAMPARPKPDVDLQELVLAFTRAMKRAEAFEHHQISKEKLSTRERMTMILQTLQNTSKGEFVAFDTLFTPQEGKAGVVVSFLAILELIKESLVSLVQTGPYAPLHLTLKYDEENTPRTA